MRRSCAPRELQAEAFAARYKGLVKLLAGAGHSGSVVFEGRALVVGLVVGLCACDGGGGRTPATLGAYDWPARPRVIEPAVLAPGVATATIARPRLIPGALLPPIVRGPHQVEAYTQDGARVDVLWIVDNSGSLNTERMRLAAQFDRFLSVLVAGGIDYHVGVTSTDLNPNTGDQGRLRGPSRWIDRTTADPRIAFRRAVDFPFSEVSLEEGLAAMVAALSPPLSIGANAGFLRDDAALAVIVVSDEDDGSLAPLGFYRRFLEGLKGPGREANVSFSAVVGPRPDGCTPPGEEAIFGADADAGERYLDLAQQTGGLVESICNADLAPFVEQLARRLTSLRRVFPLSAPPLVASIRVRVDGRAVPQSDTNGWRWLAAERAVAFSGSFVPPPGASVEIDYDVAL